MALLPINDTKETTDLVYTPASADGDWFPNSGAESLIIVGPSAAFVVSVENGRNSNFGAHPAYPVNLPAGKTSAMTPRFSVFRFNDESGLCHLTYDNPVGVSVAVIRQHVLLEDPEPTP